MNALKHHAATSLRWSVLASGLGILLVGCLLFSTWGAFQVMVWLAQR